MRSRFRRHVSVSVAAGTGVVTLTSLAGTVTATRGRRLIHGG